MKKNITNKKIYEIIKTIFKDLNFKQSNIDIFQSKYFDSLSFFNLIIIIEKKFKIKIKRNKITKKLISNIKKIKKLLISN